MGSFVCLLAAGGELGHLGEILESRRRPLQVVDAGEALPPIAKVRALAVTGTPDEPAAGALLEDALAAELPILALGGGAALLAETRGGGWGAPQPPGLVAVSPTELADDDPVFGPLVPESLWPVVCDRAIQPPTEAEVLATSEAGVEAFRVGGRAYGVRFEAHRGALALGDGLALEGGVGPKDHAFIDAWSKSLLGRWVDQAVGRTDEEAPWGRRGPAPVPRPGLVLNPAPDTA